MNRSGRASSTDRLPTIATNLAGCSDLGADTTDLYIAPDGDDTNSGSEDSPFRTFERARDELRDRRATGRLGTDGATVIVTGGRYQRSKTFTLTAADSGTPDAPVVYRAASGETVVLDGGHVMSPQAFTPVEDTAIRDRLIPAVRDEVVTIDLDVAGITDYGSFGPRGWGRPTRPAPMELFIDERPQTVARWPNDDTIPLGEVHETGTITTRRWWVDKDGEEGDDPGVFEYNTDRAARWTEAEDPYVTGLFGVAWANDTIDIVDIDTDAGTFTTGGPHAYGFHQPGHSGVETHYYIVNLLEEIERPGEYYIDREAGTLYVYPPYPLEYSLLQVSSLTTPFVTMGDASHVTLAGFCFENARDSGITIEAGANVSIRGCTLRNLGGAGMTIDGGSEHRIESCDIYQTGRGGVDVCGGDRSSLERADHLVRNCDIQRVTRWMERYNPAINVSGVGITAEHNHLHHADHQAIFFAGNDHRFAYNEIHRVNGDLSDMGSIYVGRNPTYAGNAIEHNFFHHLETPHEGGPGVQAIFLDDDVIYVAAIHGNVFYRTGSTGVIKLHGGGGTSIANNLAIDCPEFVQENPGGTAGIARAVEKMETDLFGHGFPDHIAEVGIDQEPYRSRYPYLYETYGEGYNEGTPVWNNVELTSEHDALTNPDELDFELDSGAFADRSVTGIVDRVADVKGERVSFEPIPFEEIGLVADEFRHGLEPTRIRKLGPTPDASAVDPSATTCWWTPAPTADKYVVELQRDGETEAIEVADNWVVLDGLAAHQTYRWNVEVIADESRSIRGQAPARGDPWTFTTGAP